MPDTIEEFHVRNPRDWKRLIDELFPIMVPTRAKWDQLDDIIAVLNQIGSIPNVNHIFFPESGGLDLRGASKSKEEGLIDLNCDGFGYYAKPQSLAFESFGDTDNYQWSYFRLELEPIQDTGVYKGLKATAFTEELLELPSGEYADRSNWDAGEHRGKSLPWGSRVIIRLLKGSLVIFQKSSFYNKIPGTYNAPHNKVDSERFRHDIAVGREHVLSRLADSDLGLKL